MFLLIKQNKSKLSSKNMVKYTTKNGQTPLGEMCAIFGRLKYSLVITTKLSQLWFVLHNIEKFWSFI